jgi:hypothetical protein
LPVAQDASHGGRGIYCRRPIDFGLNLLVTPHRYRAECVILAGRFSVTRSRLPEQQKRAATLIALGGQRARLFLSDGGGMARRIVLNKEAGA